jgi:TonB family protein
MTEAAKEWVGQIVDGAFPLRQYLGGTDHSAVFMTEYAEGGAEPRKAVIKLFPADPASADAQVLRWESVAQLSHPNLLRLFSGGRCKLEGNDLAYLVMEYAEENLAQILPQRALTPEETRDMLGPVLDALEYLHGKGLVHGDLKPANILASADQLKLSSDTIARIGESQGLGRRPGAYDAPEAISGKLTAAADVWALGTTLVEVMTQRLPDWQPGPQREPVTPANLPAPFQEIARACLRLEPDRRAKIGDIAGRLNARAVAAAASASGAAIDSVSMQSPSMSAVAGPTSLPSPKTMTPKSLPPQAAARLQTNPHRPPPYKASGTRPRFLLPLVACALIFAAIITVPRLLTHRPETRSSSAVPSQKPVGQAETAKSSTSASQPKIRQTVQPSSANSLKATSEKVNPDGAAAASPSAGSAEAVNPATAGNISAKGEVLDQVLPDASQKALATIHGKVRVGIKVHVDAAGAVSGAELDSPGPSQFFADLTLKAARKWVFTPPEVNGKSVASEWRLRFVFTQSGAKVTATQTVP